MRENVRSMSLDGHVAMPWDSGLDLQALAWALWRWRSWVIGPALIVALAVALLVNAITPRYKSEARVLVDGRENVFLRPEAERPGDRQDQSLIDQEGVTSQVQLALSRDLARQVIRDLKLGQLAEFDPVVNGVSPLTYALRLLGVGKDLFQMTPEERALEAYYERLKVYQVEKSRVIAIEFTSSDPELAAAAANKIAQSYVAVHRASKQEETSAAGRWLAGEIETLRRKVADAEGKVEEFRARSNLFVGANNTTLSNQQLAELNSQLAAARSRKADSESKAQVIREMLRTGKALESTDFWNSELIRRLAEQRVILRAQLAEQSSTLLDGHPRIKELKAQINDLDRAIRDEAEKLVRSLENDATIADARMQMLSNNLEQLKREATSINGQDVELRALEREAKAQRDLLESYLAKYRETTARDSLSAMPSEARIISRATVSSTPYFPRKLPIVLIAALATFFVTAGWITTREVLGGNPAPGQGEGSEPGEVPVEEPGLEPVVTSVRAASAPQSDAPEVVAAQAATGPEPEPFHVLAAPLIAEAEREAPNAVAARAPAGPDAEASEALQAPPGPERPLVDIAGELRNRELRRVLVVRVGREGSSGVAALELARGLGGDVRTVVVDLASQLPKADGSASGAQQPGIAELVHGTASFGQIITRDRSSRVHLVPPGRLDRDTADVLGSERLRMGIRALSQAYDHVILNAGSLDDAHLSVFGELTSAAVLVGVASPEEIASAKARLSVAGMTEIFASVAPAGADAPVQTAAE